MARPARYYVYDMTLKLFVGGVVAKTDEDAADLAKGFGPDTRATLLKDARGSWKEGSGEVFWIKSSQYGQKYRCKTCGRDSLGIGESMHRRTCPLSKTAAREQ